MAKQDKEKTYLSEIDNSKEIYVLEMFPYPSGKFTGHVEIIQWEMLSPAINDTRDSMFTSYGMGCFWHASRKCRYGKNITLEHGLIKTLRK